MKINTFADDLLGLKSFAKQLSDFIKVEQNFVNDGLVIALSSKFGSGKTSFFNMWSNSLADLDKEHRPTVVYLNAWESDYLGDPLFSIVSSLAQKFKEDGGTKSANKVLEAAKDIAWLGTAISAQMTNKFTGIDPVAASEFVKEKKRQRRVAQSNDPSPFSLFEERKKAFGNLKSVIKESIGSQDLGVLFLVDELDRCRPDYAIFYLETIKHIFDIKGAVFVLAADRQHLENSARTAFGKNLDFEEYYRKFIHREISLPPITDEGYKNITLKYIQHYLVRDDSRICFADLSGGGAIDRIYELITGLKFTPRQSQEMFRTLGHVFSTSSEKKGKLLWGLASATILMAALRIKQNHLYTKLGSKSLGILEAHDFFRSFSKEERNINWWITLLFTGDGLIVGESSDEKKVMLAAGLINGEGDSPRSRDLGSWFSAWGHSSSGRLTQTYKKIEEAARWGD